jgi:ribonucleoside-diphosphate reductase alpha chain
MELLFNLNHGLTGKDIFRILISAWQQKIKAIYYVRTVQKDSFIEAECSACAN